MVESAQNDPNDIDVFKAPIPPPPPLQKDVLICFTIIMIFYSFARQISATIVLLIMTVLTAVVDRPSVIR